MALCVFNLSLVRMGKSIHSARRTKCSRILQQTWRRCCFQTFRHEEFARLPALAINIEAGKGTCSIQKKLTLFLSGEGGRPMTTMREYRCEICGIVDSHPIRWFAIQCGDSQLTVFRWNSEAADAAGAKHFCGEGHAEVYISRWFDSICSPPKPDFNRASPTR